MMTLLLRVTIGALSRVAPEAAGRMATWLFFRTPPRRSSDRVASLLADGRRATVTVRGRDVVMWTWGEGPRVMLVHGWGGRGGQLATFVPGLLERGCSAVTFDGPGHGASAGHESSLVHMAEAILAVQTSVGTIHGIVTHSMGASAATFAMTRGLDVSAAVFLGPPSHPSDWPIVLGARLGLTNRAIAIVRRESVRRVGARWDEIDTIAIARTRNVPLLIVHDVTDDEVPAAQGEELAAAWPGALFVATTGLGHRRILSDPEVIRRTVEFIASAVPRDEPARESVAPSPRRAG